LKREDLSAVGWKAMLSMAERRAVEREKAWCVAGLLGSAG
jgi:hypothetical protein